MLFIDVPLMVKIVCDQQKFMVNFQPSPTPIRMNFLQCSVKPIIKIKDGLS